ncbi:hypothetical protein BZA05DRAFT_47446 [Tricharina praecox]|uniref:uncharacterized protein n=1 Tax=Tricharina praecox TaxID=43433 RepID=UPI00221FD431|nr:uncharacterized protein BZA05DRAFT_47446 [Tricharina praecox]KAI5851940.1 hypothetical protein BZA05DRAFT_47446 [Tricharina praecox]
MVNSPACFGGGVVVPSFSPAPALSSIPNGANISLLADSVRTISTPQRPSTLAVILPRTTEPSSMSLLRPKPILAPQVRTEDFLLHVPSPVTPLPPPLDAFTSPPLTRDCREHISTHTLPFSCDICERRFSSRFGLTRHTDTCRAGGGGRRRLGGGGGGGGGGHGRRDENLALHQALTQAGSVEAMVGILARPF